MSDRIRLRATFVAVVEYDARLSDYDTDDPAKVARIDLESAEEDTYLFLDHPGIEWKITVEPVTEPSA